MANEKDERPKETSVKVRLNPRLWALNEFQVDETTYVHGKTYTVSAAQYEKLSAHKTRHFGGRLQTLIKA